MKTARAAGFGAMVALVVFCAGCTTGGSKEVAGVSNFGQVTPEIWRGGKPTREGMRWLADRGVKTIIDLQMEDESADVPAGVRDGAIRVALWGWDFGGGGAGVGGGEGKGKAGVFLLS